MSYLKTVLDPFVCWTLQKVWQILFFTCHRPRSAQNARLHQCIQY